MVAHLRRLHQAVSPSHALFSAIEVVGLVAVINEVFLIPLCTREQLLRSLSLISICHFRHTITSCTIHSLRFCVAPSSPSWWLGFQVAWLPLCQQGILGQLVRQMLPGVSLQHRDTTQFPKVLPLAVLFEINFLFWYCIVCDMVCMCTEMSSALCSSDLPPFSPFLMFIFSSFVVSLSQSPGTMGYH